MDTIIDFEIVPIGFNAIPKYKPAPNTSMARREVDFTKFSNENLKFTLDLLSLHYSPYLNECLAEIQQRMSRGEWLNLENSPPPSHELPWLLTIFPFRLLWHQRKK